MALVPALLVICISHLSAQGRKVRLEEGTILNVKSLSEISSKTAQSGDLVDFISSEAVVINNDTLIALGARVFATIEESDHAKSLGKQGEIKIAFSGIRAVDGQKVPIHASSGKKEGKNTVGATVALAVVLSPLFLLKKGKEVVIPAGKVMEAYVAQDVMIELK